MTGSMIVITQEDVSKQINKVGEILKAKGPLIFADGSNQSTFAIRLEEGKLDVYGYFDYINKQVDWKSLSKESQKKNLHGKIMEINSKLQEILYDIQKRLKNDLKEKIASVYPAFGPLDPKMQDACLSMDNISRINELYGIFDNSYTGPKARGLVRKFLNNPSRYGYLGIQWKKAIEKAIEDRDGRIAKEAQKLGPEDRMTVVFTQEEKREISAWIKNDKKLDSELYKKVLNFASGMRIPETAFQALKNNTDLTEIALAVRQIGMSVDANTISSISDSINDTYQRLGMILPKRISRA